MDAEITAAAITIAIIAVIIIVTIAVIIIVTIAVEIKKKSGKKQGTELTGPVIKMDVKIPAAAGLTKMTIIAADHDTAEIKRVQMFICTFCMKKLPE
ncbi:MAG: hypothetical protein QM657_14210 [Lacrimispora sp.]